MLSPEFLVLASHWSKTEDWERSCWRLWNIKHGLRFLFCSFW